MDERKEFEEWLRDYDPDASTTRADDVYIGGARHRAMHATYASVQMLWDAWKARAARAEPSAEPTGEVVVSWTQDRSRIVAVTRQDEEGRILSVIAVAPVAAQPSGGCNGMPAYEGPLSAAQAPATNADALDALRQIAEWPDGGNRYGQENIKRFAQHAIDAMLKARETSDD